MHHPHLANNVAQTTLRLLRPQVPNRLSIEDLVAAAAAAADEEGQQLSADEVIAAAWRERFARWRAEPRYERRYPDHSSPHPDDEVIDAEIVETPSSDAASYPRALPGSGPRALPRASDPDPLSNHFLKGARDAKQ